VIVYGDSVVASGAPQIAARLARAGWAPELVAYPGTDVGHIAAKVRAAPALTDVVVLGVGYTYFWKPFVLQRQIDAAMQALTDRGVRRVIWLNVREVRAERRDVNDALAAAARRWPTLDVADWNGYSRGHDDAFVADGYHLAAAGGRLMGDLMALHLAGERMGWRRSLGPAYGPRPAIRSAVAAYGLPPASVATPAAASVERGRRSPAVGIASTPSGNGYWLAHRDGHVEAHGDARRIGSERQGAATAPIVGIAATPSGRGYWLAGSDGRVRAFGDAPFRGSAHAVGVRSPIVGIAATPAGRGYWLVASDGGVFTFGDARYFGSTRAVRRAEPIVGIAAHPSGRGYWLVAFDGGVFAFGAARFHGSGATEWRYWKIEGIAAAPDGNGYSMLAASGDVLPFGSSRTKATVRIDDQLAVACTARPGGGLFVLGQRPA
jgi:hypothetical protein